MPRRFVAAAAELARGVPLVYQHFHFPPWLQPTTLQLLPCLLLPHPRIQSSRGTNTVHISTPTMMTSKTPTTKTRDACDQPPVKVVQLPRCLAFIQPAATPVRATRRRACLLPLPSRIQPWHLPPTRLQSYNQYILRATNFTWLTILINTSSLSN